MRPVNLLGLGFLIGATAMGVLLTAVSYRWQVEAYPENAQQASTAAGGQAMSQQATAGKGIFDQKCSGCHSIGSGKRVGPDLKGVTAQRPHDWLVQFITAPDKVIASGDPTAKQLLQEYGSPMPNLGITSDQAEQLIAYIDFQSGGSGGGAAPAKAAASPAPAGGAAAGSPTMPPGMTMTVPPAGGAATKAPAGATTAPAPAAPAAPAASPAAGGSPASAATPAAGGGQAPAAPPAAGGAANPQQALAGKTIFDQKCSGCHSTGTDKRVGPGLQGVASQRPHDWLVQFITAPDKVIASGDPTAKQLVQEYGSQMPNLGITPAQAEQIIAYLQTLASGGPPAAAGGTAAAPPPAPGNPGNGERLFTGEMALSKGGPACIACHNVAGAGALGGGSWGLDLTQTISKNSAGGVASIMLSPPFPGMKEAFQEHPISDSEAADLAAFFDSTNSRQAGSAAAGFPILGIAALALFLILMRLIWGGRLRAVRQLLVGGTAE